MNSRLERLKVTIEKCLKVEEVFARQGIRGQEPIHYDDIIAGFNAPARSGFLFGWDLVFKTPVRSAPKEEQEGREPTYIEVRLASEQADGRLIEVTYFPANNSWVVVGSTLIGWDGTETVRNLAADCQLSAGDWRKIGEDEAMKIIATLAAFYKRQPAA
jgi:hypothetical protein